MTSAVTSAPRSRVRRSGCGSSRAGREHQRGDVLGAGQGGGDVRLAGADAAPGRERVGDGRLPPLAAGDAGQQLPVRGVDREVAAEDLREHRGDLLDPAAVDQHVGEPVVRDRGALDGGGVLGHRPVGRVEVGEEPRVLQRHRGVGRERRQQRDLRRREGPHRAVHREQRADHAAVEHQRDAEDRADPLARDRLVDVAAVHEPLVGLVVLGEVRRTRLRHQAEQAGAERKPQRAELRGQRAVGDLHVRRALGLVVEREVGHVGVQQLPRPAHDRGQDLVDVADRGQVARGLVERAQLGLARLPPGEQLTDPQRHVVLPAQRGELVAGRPGRLGIGDHPVERRARRLAVEEVQERVGHRAVPVQDSRTTVMLRSPKRTRSPDEQRGGLARRAARGRPRADQHRAVGRAAVHHDEDAVGRDLELGVCLRDRHVLGRAAARGGAPARRVDPRGGGPPGPAPRPGSVSPVSKVTRQLADTDAGGRPVAPRIDGPVGLGGRGGAGGRGGRAPVHGAGWHAGRHAGGWAGRHRRAAGRRAGRQRDGRPRRRGRAWRRGTVHAGADAGHRLRVLAARRDRCGGRRRVPAPAAWRSG